MSVKLGLVLATLLAATASGAGALTSVQPKSTAANPSVVSQDLKPAQTVPPTSTNSEMAGDLADNQLQMIEIAIKDNPMLMKQVVTNIIRDNPGIVQAIIRDTLLRDPSIVVASLQEYQRQRAGQSDQSTTDKASADFVKQADSSANAPIRGNPSGSVTMVEFSDYNCEYCRAYEPILDQLIKNNKDLRVVQRQWPILSPDSVEVARLALASEKQGKFATFHDALMKLTGKTTKAKALALAKQMGMNITKLEQDSEDMSVTQHIRQTAALAKEAHFRGTPGLLIGDTFVRGMIPEAASQKIIDQYKIK